MSNFLLSEFSKIELNQWCVNDASCRLFKIYTSTFPLCVNYFTCNQVPLFQIPTLSYSFTGYIFNSDTDSNTEKAILFYHRVVEAFKFAYARRSELGDNATDEVSVLHLSK